MIATKFFREHISQMYRTCLHDLRRVRRYLSLRVANTIATALVTGRLDYYNPHFQNISRKDITTKLRRVQSCLVRGCDYVSTFYSFCATSNVSAFAFCPISILYLPGTFLETFLTPV